jgi:hypothetical protein
MEAITVITRAGGLAIPFISEISPELMLLTALLAYSRAGLASARSLSQLYFYSLTSSLII